MKSTMKRKDASFTCDDLPMPVVIHRQSNGQIVQYNKPARKIFGLPVAVKAMHINKIRPIQLPDLPVNKTKDFIDYGPVLHRTVKGKEIALNLLRKKMMWHEMDCYVDFLEQPSEIISVKNEIIKTSIDAFVSVNENNIIVDWNSAAENIFGWKKKEVLGRNMVDVIIPEQHRKQHLKGFAHYLKTGESTIFGRLIEVSGLHKKGHVFPIELTINAVSEHGKKIFYSFIRDISNRKEAEQELKQSESNFKRAQSIASVGSWEMSGKFLEAFWSDEFYRIHGLEPQSVKPSTKLRLSMVHPKDRAKLESAIDLAIRQGKPYSIEKRIIRPGGEIRWVLSQGAVEIDPVTGRRKIFGTLLDITSRKRVEEEQMKLRQSLADFQNAVEKSSIVSRTDKEGTITYVNDKFLSISGYSAIELIGQNHRIINSGHHPKSFWTDMWKIISNGKIWRADVKNKAKDGSYYWVDTFVMPFLDEHGKVKELLSIRNDITSKKQSEEALAVSNTSLSETLIFGKMGSAELDLQTFQLCVSKELYQLLEVPVSEPQIVPFEQFVKAHVHPEFMASVQQKVTEGMINLKDSRKVVHLEFEMITATGKKIWIDGKGIFKGKTGLGILQDITERKNAQEILRQNKQKYRLLYNNIPSMYFTLDRSLNVRLVNDLGATQLGYMPEELMSGSVLKVFPDDLHPVVIQQVEECFANPKKIFEWEIKKVKKNGELIIVREKAWVEPSLEGEAWLNILCEDITERKKAVQEIIKQKELSNSIINSLPGVFYLFDESGKFLRWNKNFEVVTGYSAEEISRLTPLDLFDADDQLFIQQKIGEALQIGKAEAQADFFTKNKTKVPYHFNGWLIDYEGKQCLIGVGIDISLQKEAEKDAADKARLIETILNGITDSIFALDKEMNFTLVNPAFAAFRKLPMDEMLGRNVLDLFPHVKNTAFEATLKGVLQTQKAITFEHTNSSDAQQVFQLSVYPNPEGLFVYSKDVSEKKKFQDALTESELRNRLIVENSGEGILFTDSGGTIYSANPEACHILQMTERQICEAGRTNILDMTDPVVVEKIEERNKVGFLKGELFMRRGDGSIFPAEISSKVFLTPDGKRNATVLFKDVSEKKKVEMMRAELLSRFEKLANNIPGFIYEFRMRKDGTSHFPFVSNGIKEIYGLSPQEVVDDAAPMFARVHPDDKERIGREVTQAAKTLTASPNEFRVQKISGKIIWVRTNASIEPQSDGSLLWYGYAVDITSQKEIEVALAASEARYRSILEQFPLSVVTYNTEGLTISGNKAWETLWDDKFENALDHNILKDPLLASMGVSDYIQRAFTGEVIETPTIKFEPALIGKRGRTRWIKALFFPLKDKQDKILEIISIQQDLTEIKIAEEEIRESEERFRMMADSAPVLIWMSGTDKSCFYFNKVWCEFTGRTLEQEMGNGWAEGVHPDDLDRCISIYTNHFDQRKSFEMEYRLKRNDGHYRWLVDSGRPRFLPNGEFVGFIGSCFDITERKEAEDKIIKTSWLYEVTSQINQMMIHVKTKKEVFAEVCRIAHAHGKFAMAWIGLIDPVTKVIKPVVWSGFEAGYFNAVEEISVKDVPSGRGPTGRAAREGRAFVNNNIADSENHDYDIWRKEALLRDYHSSIGLPIIVNEEVIGVFTLYKSEPFFFTDKEVQLLEEVVGNIAFSLKMIDNETDRQNKEMALVESEARFRLLVRDINIGILLQGPKSEIQLSNEAALDLLGLTEDQLLGRSSFSKDWNVIHEDGLDFPGYDHPVPLAIRTRKSVRSTVMGVYRPLTKDRVWLLVDAIPRLNEYGEVLNVICTFNDITDRKKTEEALLASNREKDLLIKEIHHRVKNNLQLISSIIYVKMRSIPVGGFKDFLENTRQKIRSIALIHERLLQTGSVNQVNTLDYLGKLIVDLQMTNNRSDLDVLIEPDIDSENMNLDIAIYCGLIINELVTNAIKHAFVDRSHGIVKIGLHRDQKGGYQLTVSDDGNSIPKEVIVGVGKTSSFGMQMLDIFVKQLNGKIEISRTRGTTFHITF